ATGGSGNDTITGNATANLLQGNAGNDTIDGGLGADLMSGGAGTDTVTYASRATNITVTIDALANDGASGETDRVFSDVENLIGGTGADRFTGNSAANTFTGNAGNDTLTGLAGN